MAIEKYHINTQVLEETLAEAQKNPKYTRGDLDLLQENFQNNLAQVLDIPMIIDHTK